MKLANITVLALLALLPLAMLAQEAPEMEKLNARVDSLAEETTTLGNLVQKLNKFKVSAYIQGQFRLLSHLISIVHLSFFSSSETFHTVHLFSYKC